MGFYDERDKQAGDSDNPWTKAARFDPDELGSETVDAGQFSYEDFNGPVDASTQTGDTGPLGHGN